MNILQVTLQVVTSHEGSFLAATHKIKTWNNEARSHMGCVIGHCGFPYHVNQVPTSVNTTWAASF